MKPPKRWPVTIIGSSFKLTVRYPKIPWQHIKNSKNAVIRLILAGNLYLNAVTVSAIATKPKKAAKYLWTTSGIALSISYGNWGYLCSARRTSASEVGNTTKP